MKWVFIILCFLLLLFSFEPLPHPGRNDHYLMLWKISSRLQLLRIFPHDVYVLVSDGLCYLYKDATSDIYVYAVRIDTGRKYLVLNHLYLVKRSRRLPEIYFFESSSEDVVDVLNTFSKNSL